MYQLYRADGHNSPACYSQTHYPVRFCEINNITKWAKLVIFLIKIALITKDIFLLHALVVSSVYPCMNNRGYYSEHCLNSAACVPLWEHARQLGWSQPRTTLHYRGYIRTRTHFQAYHLTIFLIFKWKRPEYKLFLFILQCTNFYYIV